MICNSCAGGGGCSGAGVAAGSGTYCVPFISETSSIGSNIIFVNLMCVDINVFVILQEK